MEQTTSQPAKKSIIRLIYLYLVSLIGLVVFLIGGVGIVNTGLNLALNVDDTFYNSPKMMCREPYQFYSYTGRPVPAKPEEMKPVDTNSQEYKDCVKEQEEQSKKQADNNRRREIAQSLAMMILGAPIWLYHWNVIQRDNKQHVS